MPADYALLQELAVHQEEVRAQNAQLREMQRHLELSRDRYADLYDFAPLAYVSLDSSGTITEVNLTGAKLLGMQRPELIGRPLGAFVARSDLNRFLDHLRRCRLEQELSAEVQLQSIDGRSFPAHLTTHVAQPAVGAGDALFRTAITDLTEYQRVEEDRQNALLRESAARAASETKDRLIAMVSHELRTPLSAVLLWAKILQIKLVGHDEASHALEVIVRSAEAQRQLIDDLLDISRISSGKLRLELRHIALAPLVSNAVESVLPAARAKAISIEAQVASEIGMVRVDPDRLRQVLWNLLNNSVKFTPEGGQIRLEAERVGMELDLRVSDTGQGIDPTLLPHIFEPFRQAESPITTRSHGGLGLGLAISKQLIEQHGGHIHVTSEGIGRGATFVVRLPLMAIRPEAQGLGASSFSEVAASPDPAALAGIQVLLVEDEAATRGALETLLGAAGARLIAVDSAQAAIDVFRRLRPDVIVGDIGMPGVDGYQMMQQLRGMEQAGGQTPTPAVALTAFASSDDRDRAREAGYNVHLAKPVEPSELVTTLQRLARGSPVEAAAPTGPLPT